MLNCQNVGCWLELRGTLLTTLLFGQRFGEPRVMKLRACKDFNSGSVRMAFSLSFSPFFMVCFLYFQCFVLLSLNPTSFFLCSFFQIFALSILLFVPFLPFFLVMAVISGKAMTYIIWGILSCHSKDSRWLRLGLSKIQWTKWIEVLRNNSTQKQPVHNRARLQTN